MISSARLRRWLLLALLWGVALLFLVPLLWMLSSSLKPTWQIFETPPRWLPDPPRWENYSEALTTLPFGRYLRNTTVITLLTIVGHLLSCTLVAYAFARLRAPGRDTLFVVMLATLMLPYPVTMTPLYVIFHRLGWINTFLPLTVPAFLGSPFYIFLLRQFFLTIPRDLKTPHASTAPTPCRSWPGSWCRWSPRHWRPSPSSPFRPAGTISWPRSSICSAPISTR